MDDAERAAYEAEIKESTAWLDEAREHLGDAIELLNEIKNMTKL